MKEKSDLTWACRWTHSVGSQSREGPLVEGSWRTGPVSSACSRPAGLLCLGCTMCAEEPEPLEVAPAATVLVRLDGGSRVQWTQHHSLWGPCGPVATRENQTYPRDCEDARTLQGLAPGQLLGQVPAMLVRPGGSSLWSQAQCLGGFFDLAPSIVPLTKITGSLDEGHELPALFWNQ